MSGGSWDYVYGRVEDAAVRLLREEDPRRRALGRVLKRCATALHDIEWVDSSDMGEGDEVQAILDALGEPATMLIATEVLFDLLTTVAQANVAISMMKQYLAKDAS